MRAVQYRCTVPLADASRNLYKMGLTWAFRIQPGEPTKIKDLSNFVVRIWSGKPCPGNSAAFRRKKPRP